MQTHSWWLHKFVGNEMQVCMRSKITVLHKWICSVKIPLNICLSNILCIANKNHLTTQTSRKEYGLKPFGQRPKLTSKNNIYTSHKHYVQKVNLHWNSFVFVCHIHTHARAYHLFCIFYWQRFGQFLTLMLSVSFDSKWLPTIMCNVQHIVHRWWIWHHSKRLSFSI